MKPKITFYDVHAIDQQQFQSALGNAFELTFSEAGLTAETAPLAAEAEVLSVHVSSNVTAELMEKMPNLKHVACRSTGFDNCDLAYAKAHGITISSVPSYGENTVAEYAFMLILALSRRLTSATRAVQSGEVITEQLTGHDLAGKTLGVVGTGRIGRHSAKIGRGFEMNVVAYDKFPNAEAAKETGFEYAELDELLARADVITIHAPATPETDHMINGTAFAKMKNGVILVNTARGTIIDTTALIEALSSGKVAAAGLDVLEGEEYELTEPEIHLLAKKTLGEEARQALGIDILSKMPNVLITSHNAFNSAEALGRIRDTTAANITAWHAGKPQNLVGQPS